MMTTSSRAIIITPRRERGATSLGGNMHSAALRNFEGNGDREPAAGEAPRPNTVELLVKPHLGETPPPQVDGVRLMRVIIDGTEIWEVPESMLTPPATNDFKAAATAEASKHSGTCTETLHAAFKAFDTDGDGHLSPDEMLAILTRPMSKSHDLDAAKDVIDFFDFANDGKLSLDEFINACEGGNRYKPNVVSGT
jgi:hypothetical protein